MGLPDNTWNLPIDSGSRVGACMISNNRSCLCAGHLVQTCAVLKEGRLLFLEHGQVRGSSKEPVQRLVSHKERSLVHCPSHKISTSGQPASGNASLSHIGNKSTMCNQGRLVCRLVRLRAHVCSSLVSPARSPGLTAGPVNHLTPAIASRREHLAWRSCIACDGVSNAWACFAAKRNRSRSLRLHTSAFNSLYQATHYACPLRTLILHPCQSDPQHAGSATTFTHTAGRHKICVHNSSLVIAQRV